MPGFNKSDIIVEMSNGVLSARGTKKELHAEQGGMYFRHERPVGKAFRSLQMPSDADAGHMSCEYADGLLTARCPKLSASSSSGMKKITIE